MAFVKKIETKRTKNSKPQPSFQVRWQEPKRDSMGRPIPLDPAKPDGQKQQIHLKETYGSKEEAQERCDELNAQRHRTSAQSASEIRKAGDLPYGHYAAAWLESLEVKVARGQLKERTLDDYRKLLHRYVLGRFGGKRLPRSLHDRPKSSWRVWFDSSRGKVWPSGQPHASPLPRSNTPGRRLDGC